LTSGVRRSHLLLSWAAFVIPAVGAAVAAAGLVGIMTTGDEPVIAGVSGWYLWMFGSLGMLGGSGLFAIATLRARTLSRRAAGLLGTGSVAIVPAIVGAMGGPAELAQILMATSLVAFAGGWVGLGFSALRTGRTAVPARLAA
jgi:hypothetical protein